MLPEAEFVAPNAPQPCDMASFGYQWFSLRDWSEEFMRRGLLEAAPVLDDFLDRLLADRGLTPDRLALAGFSQGTMMALHVAPRRAAAMAGVVGYSGALLAPQDLAAEARQRPPVFLAHGMVDTVVPFAAMGAAEAALRANGFSVECDARPGLGHGIDAEGIARGGHFLKRVLARVLGNAAQ